MNTTATANSTTVPLNAARSRALAVLAVPVGLLSVVVGLGLGLIGMGFANATASGTGAAAAFVGVWTALAARGILRRRRITLIGLGVAWAWLAVRVATDVPATASSAIVVLFLLPVLSVPLISVWALLTLVFLAALAYRTFRLVRPGMEGVRGAAVRLRGIQVVGVVVRVLLLGGCTLGVPQVVWLDRGSKIAGLAEAYPPRETGAVQAPALGACSMVFLGYELTQHGTGGAKSPAAREAAYTRALADAEAELASLEAAGSYYVRVGASGDQLLESKPDQERIDDRYMAAVRRTGKSLVLVDTQHPKVLQQRRLDWPSFCRFQRDRIAYYQERYQPRVYFVVCEPLSYHQFALTKESRFSADAWAAQLSEMCRLVKSNNAATRTGICLLVMPGKDLEWEVWTRMRELPELDILSVEIYEPDNFRQTEARLRQFGHPRSFGKAFWIAETYNGWALCGQRRWDQDAAWVRLAANFAGVIDAEAVLIWSFGTFVPGGSFWDFGNGGLQQRWRQEPRLSTVGRTFLDLARRFGPTEPQAGPKARTIPSAGH